MIFIQFLGTSAGTPSRTRNVSSLIFRVEGQRNYVMVDCGEGTQHQLLRTDCSPGRISDIFISHLHGDHCLGLPGLLSSRSLAGCQEPLSIYGPPGLEGFLGSFFKYISEGLAYPLTIREFHPEDEQRGPVTDTRVKKLRAEYCVMEHGVTSLAWKFTYKSTRRRLDHLRLQKAGIPPGPIYGELLRGKDITLKDGKKLNSNKYTLDPLPGLSFIVAGDNANIGLLDRLTRGSALLIHEATFLAKDRQRLSYPSGHSSLEELCAFKKNHPDTELILTHFSPRYHTRCATSLTAEYQQTILATGLPGIHLATDFMKGSLSRDQLSLAYNGSATDP